MNHVSGLADLERRMKALARDQATKVGQAANRAGTKKLADSIRAEAPEGPTPEGQLMNRKRKSGKVVQEPHKKIKNHVKIKKVRVSEGSVENAVSIDVVHAGMVEFGSIHNPADPFMTRGFEKAKDDAIEEVKKVIDRRLKEAGV